MKFIVLTIRNPIYASKQLLSLTIDNISNHSSENLKTKKLINMEGVFIRNNSGTVICVFLAVSNFEPAQKVSICFIVSCINCSEFGNKNHTNLRLHDIK